MTDGDGPLTEAERERARAALAQRARDLAAARARGEPLPRTSPGKFDGFAPGVDDDGRPFPPPRPVRDAQARDGDHGGMTHSESGDAAAVPGLVVDDLDDLDQVTAIPAMPGMSFRGGGADWWEVGQSYVEPGWLRSSRDPLIGTGNFAHDEAVALFGPAGRDVAGLTDHPEEQETVFLPGSRFTVVRRGDLEGLWVTVLYVHRDDEPAPPGDASDEVIRVASVLARSRSLPPQPVARPGRFAGEFGTRPVG